ncbi:Fc.00g080590.m01.CDS01 [Cosmosporella sp. VM-42]
MTSQHPVMAGRIASLQDSAFALCTSINTHLKISGSEHKSELKGLVVELRLLGGALHSILNLVHELEDNDDENSRDQSPRRQKIEWPVVDGCELLIEALKSLFPYSNPEGLRDAKAALLGYRSKLGFVLGSSETLDDISLHFSVLGKEPLPQLHRNEDKKVDKSSTSQDASDVEEEEPTAEQVSSWLTILNSAEEDREPAEYCEEKSFLQTRRLTTPQYQTAAARWPRHAEYYWTKLRPQICSLFRIPKSYNFVQWVLEYARETYPRIFGSSALSPKVLLELTDALCDGSISSFHIAAALGLPSLCRDLLSMGADINQRSLLGTPLYCALVGPKVLATQAEPESWTSLLDNNHHATNRAATILLLLEKKADCKYQYRWKNAEEGSLAGLAFWTALVTKHVSLFRLVVESGASLDKDFIAFLQRGTLAKQGCTSKARFARLLTCVYDFTLAATPKADPELMIDRSNTADELMENIRKTTCQIMKAHNLDFSFFEDSRRIRTVGAALFHDLVQNAILDSQNVLFRRLSYDPRFDSNLPMSDSQDGFSLLHLASEGSQLEMIDTLIKAGASLGQTDVQGRTPVMVVEEPTALAKLVLDHGARTTDVDVHGRTIWHLAAASNDVVLLKWLIENDPSKEECLAMVNDKNATPLGDALFYVYTLKLLPKGSKLAPPTAARLLLKEYREMPQPRLQDYFHAAVQWGEMDLLDGLLKLEPNFWESDLMGRSMLHFLNLSASEDLTCRVMELCQGLPIHTQHSSTPAETIITNTPLIKTGLGGFPKASHHPACHHLLDKGVYNKLLTREVLQYRDSEGRGIWQRFCAKVIPMLNGSGHELPPEQLNFFIQSIGVAVSCLAQHGAMADYEKESAKSAFLCLVNEGVEKPLGKTFPSWMRWLYLTVLEVSHNDATEEFLKSGTAVNFFLQCTSPKAGTPDLVDLLIKRGAPVLEPNAKYDGGLSVAESVVCILGLEAQLVEVLLKHIKVERLHTMFLHLIRADTGVTDRVLSTLKHFIRKGLDLNRMPTEPGSTRSILADAIYFHEHKLANFLLDHGADPAFGSSGYDALMAAVEAGCDEILSRIIPMLEQNDEYDWDNYYDPPSGKSTFNPLQMAASKGHISTLMLLLERTDLVSFVNDVTPRNKSPPVHLAIKARSLDCFMALINHDAEVDIHDGDGLTPLKLAAREGFQPVIHFLLHEYGVDEELDESDIISSLVVQRQPPTRRILPAGLNQQFITPSQFRDAEKAFTPLVRRRLGLEISRSIDSFSTSSRYQGGPRMAMDTLLQELPIKHFRAAILPCNGCTPLSFAAYMNKPDDMLELVTNGAEGFITGCHKHWPSGFNAIVSVFDKLDDLLCETEDGPENFLSYLGSTLDAYLDLGMLWFHLPRTPLHAICFGTEDSEEHELTDNSAALRVFLDHIDEHADKYWKLIEKSGMVLPLGLHHSDDDQDTTAKVLSIAVNTRISHAALPKTTLSDDVTPLHILVDKTAEWLGEVEVDELKHFKDMLEELLSAGADINAQDSNGTTALHAAIFHDNKELVKILLEAGADPNIRDGSGATALAAATASLEPADEMLDLLIKYGAETWVLADMGNYVLQITKTVGAMSRLFEMGLDPYAASAGRASVVGELVVLSRFGTSSSNRSWALNQGFDFHKLAEEWPPIMRRLVEVSSTTYSIKIVLKRFPQECHYRLINPDTRPQFNPGCGAILQRDTGPLELLIDFGLDLEKECSSVGSPLMFACNNGKLHSIKVLVRRGARLSYTTMDDYGRKIVRSALHLARKNPVIVQWLLVGRHQDVKRLGWTDTASTQAVKPWSGPWRAEYILHGQDGQHGKLLEESMVLYATRLARIRSQLYGKTVPTKLVFDSPVEDLDGDVFMT